LQVLILLGLNASAKQSNKALDKQSIAINGYDNDERALGTGYLLVIY